MAMLDPGKEELKLVPEGEKLTVHLPMEFEKWKRQVLLLEAREKVAEREANVVMGVHIETAGTVLVFEVKEFLIPPAEHMNYSMYLPEMDLKLKTNYLLC